MSTSADTSVLPADAAFAAEDASRHNWMLLAFVVLIPLQNIYEGYFPRGGGGLNFLNLMFIGSLLVAWRCGGSLVRAGLNGWVLVYLGVSVISLLIGFGNVSDSALHANALKDQAIAVSFVFLAQLSTLGSSTVRRLLSASLLPLPYMLMVVFDQHNAVKSWHYSHDMRIQGTMSNLGANELAAFFVTAMLVALGLLIGARAHLRLRLWCAAAAACSGIGIALTYSRTAYVAVLLGALCIVVLRGLRLRVLVPGLLLMLALPAVLPLSVLERFSSIEVAEGARDESTENRFQFWETAGENFKERPLLGSGYHTFHHVEINPRLTDTHNFFLRELTEKGLLGAFALLGLLYAMGRLLLRGLRAAAPDSLEYGLALGMCGAFIALLCGNCFGDRFTHYPMIAHFWLYLGLVLRNLSLAAPASPDVVEPLYEERPNKVRTHRFR